MLRSEDGQIIPQKQKSPATGAFLFSVYYAMMLKKSGKTANLRTEKMLNWHKGYRWKFLLSGAVAVICVEVAVRLEGSSDITSWLFVCHIFFVTCMVITGFYMWRKYTGLAYPQVHKVLARVFFTSYILMSGTGIILLMRMLGRLLI